MPLPVPEVISRSSAMASVVDVLRSGEALPRARMAVLTGLSRSTVNGVIKTLIQQGAAVEVARASRSPSNRGRPATLVRLAGQPALVGVITLSHFELTAGVLTADGALLGQCRTRVEPLSDTFDLFGLGEQLLRQAVTAAGRSFQELTAAVLGVPGPLREGSGIAGVDRLMEVFAKNNRPMRLPAWMIGDPAEPMSTRLGVPVKAENDANLGALGEATFGAGRDLDNVVYVKLVHGVGAGLVVNKQLVRGAAGLAGEIAHIHVTGDGPLCACGRRGCLAAVLSNTPLAATTDSAAPPSRLGDVFTLAAYNGHSHTRALMEVCRMIGRVLADVCLWLSPDAIVLDGMLEGAAPEVMATITDTILLQTGPVFAASINIVTGQLATNAELFGGLAIARNNLLGAHAKRRA